MSNQLATISNLRIKKHDIQLSRLNRFNSETIIRPAHLAKLIEFNQNYFVLHSISANLQTDTLYRVRGYHLLKFLYNYIETDQGDGLDMQIFPTDLTWCLCFAIDGEICFRE